MIDDILDDVYQGRDSNWWTELLAEEERRQRRRQRINVAILVLSFAGVCAIGWWLR